MREGSFEVSLVVDSKIIEEIEEIVLDGKTYACSEPGQEYHVNIAVYRDLRTGKFPAKFLRFGLYVDGIDVQYWKRLDLSRESELPDDPRVPVCVKFWGFKQNVAELKSFVFTTPATATHDAQVSESNIQSQAGTIKIVIYEARVTSGNFNNQLVAKSINTNNGVSRENVKLQNQASLVTATGQSVSNDREKFSPLQRWENISTHPMQVVNLFYHSRNMVNLLRQLSLNSEDPVDPSRKRSVSKVDSLDDDIVIKSQRANDRIEESFVQSVPVPNNNFHPDDEEVFVIQKPRAVPFLDLSEDVPEYSWSSKLL